MYSASSWLYKCSLLVGKIENFVDFLALSEKKNFDGGPSSRLSIRTQQRIP
jgi:hypothetical protein